MQYLVLPRRYRPSRFSEVVGQKAICQTLQNALRMQRTAHAYLFCGARGTGKTSLARLFAKALNCEALENGEPCNRCGSCIDISKGHSLDVIEIDGASHRGIDDIRMLNETVHYAPSRGKYKIYLIDEVHMLTKEAFNALLKTLEEPPSQVKFFFATTEPQKVLGTIASRCQRLECQRILEPLIVAKLRHIVEDVGRVVAEEVLELIASRSEGSLRDAESYLDQLLSFAEGSVTLEIAESVFGLIPQQLFGFLTRAFQEERLVFAFELVEQIDNLGKDYLHFAEQLLLYYRKLGVDRLHNKETGYTQPQLLYILDYLYSAFNQLQKSAMPRVELEMILLHILRSKQRLPVEILVRRLDELEERLLASMQGSDVVEETEAKNEILKEPPLAVPSAVARTTMKTVLPETRLLEEPGLQVHHTVREPLVPAAPEVVSDSVYRNNLTNREYAKEAHRFFSNVSDDEAAKLKKFSDTSETKSDACPTQGITDISQPTQDKPLELTAVPLDFGMFIEKEVRKTPPPQPASDVSSSKSKVRTNTEEAPLRTISFETVLRFAAVELEGQVELGTVR